MTGATRMINGPNMLCAGGCGAINNRLYPFCDRCAQSMPGPSRSGDSMTDADVCYLKWKHDRELPKDA